MLSDTCESSKKPCEIGKGNTISPIYSLKSIYGPLIQ